MYSIMNFWDEDITDADKHAKCRISIFSGNDSSSFEKYMRNFKEI